jgi:hypothetical protein
MTPVELTLPFLEQRNYLHGTTLFEALRTKVPADAELTFKVSHRIESNRVRIEADPESPGWKARAAASLAWKRGGDRGSLAVVPMPAQAPIERLPYDESLVARACSLSGNQVVLEGDSPFSFVATLIPMYKVLLKAVHPMSRPGQWMFTRLDLDRHPTAFDELSLVLDGVAGGTLARCRVLVTRRVIGALYYSWAS